MRILLDLLASAALAVISSAQSGPPRHDGHPFLVHISAPSTVRVGSQALLRVRLTNTSKHEITADYKWNYGPVNPAYDYVCRDETGKLVAKDYARMGSLGDHAIPTLKPSQAKDEAIPIDEVCDLGQPGKYNIQLWRKDPDDPKHSVVKSNILTVTVVP